MLEDMQNEQVRARMETESLKATVSRLNERVAGLQQSQDQTFRDIADLRRSVEQANNSNTARRSDMETRLKTIEQSWDRNRQEIVNTLSERMADVMTRQAQEQNRAEVGVEHVVKPGETLSEIAKAYGVATAALIQANSLANPDSIRVGQKLFIPGGGGAR
jgi:LysM repeat protein